MNLRWRFSVIASGFLGWSILVSGCAYLSSRQTTETSRSVTGKAATPATQPALVGKYESLADEILDTRRREVDVVRTILDRTYRDAEAALARAREALGAPDPSGARPAIENLATLVGYLATEGDASVARVRKKLIEGGHHFNALAPSGVEGAAHQGAHGKPAHHAPGQEPAGHHSSKEGQGAPGQASPAVPPAGAPAQGQAPAGGQTPPGQPGQPGGHHAAGQPGHHAPGQPGHHAPGQAPGTGHAAEGTHHHAGPEAHHRTEAGHHEGNVPLIGYDPGYVVVTRAAKKTLLDASRGLARLSTSPSLQPLEVEWRKVESTCASLGIKK